MSQDFLTPIKDSVVASLLQQSQSCLGQHIQIHSKEEGFPDLENVQIAIFGVKEDRNSHNNFGCGEDLFKIREKKREEKRGNLCFLFVSSVISCL